MKLINQGYSDRVRFIVSNSEFGSKVITEPEGWNTDQKEISRHKDYHGIFPKFSNALKFVEDGKDYIKMVYGVIGINADLRLKKQIRHPKTDEWVTEYYGYLDMSTYIYEDGKVSMKFSSGGLESIIKARENEQIEVTREKTIDGHPLSPLKIDEVEFDGRRIFLKSDLEVKPANNIVQTYNQSNGNTRGSTYPVPLQIINNSHEELQAPIPNTRVGDNSWERNGNGETGLMFLAISQTTRTLKIKFKIKFLTFFMPAQPPFYTADSSGFDDINFFMFGIRLARYGGGSAYINISNHFLLSTNQYADVNFANRSLTFEQTITINAGDSLALVFDQNMDGDGGHTAHLNINITNIECDLTIEEDSFFEKSVSKTILPHELAERLVEIISNKKCVYSDALGRTDIGYPVDGIKTGALCGVSHGFWVRGFDYLPISTDEKLNPFKPLTTSLKDFIESYSATWNLGFGIETFGNTERVRIEPLEFFYNRNITIILPDSVKIKQSIDTDSIYSSLEIGYEKGGSYEEAFGLDEYNGLSKFVTIITRVKNVFVKRSKYGADSYGKEFARRKPKIKYGTQDTRYDTDIFLNDMKRGLGPVFLERKWQDDFEQAPTGTFSPETATNLRLSPFNLLLRHGRFVSSCLQKNTTDFISYISSNGNSKLKTKLIGGNEYAEDGQIINSELSRPRFTSEIVEFNHQIDFNILQMLDGYTMINGKRIPNIYGRIQYKNQETNTIEYGYLFNCKINEGEFKLLKAY